MKKLVFTIQAFVFLIVSCSKESATTTCQYQENSIVASAAEDAQLQAYFTANSITGLTKHPRGLYYKIDNAGTGASPKDLCSNVSVRYIGKLTNGNIFDQITSSQSPASFTLGSLIEGWKIGIPLIKTGGKIILYIPPSLAYGTQEIRNNQNVVIIPANSILIFEIDLISL